VSNSLGHVRSAENSDTNLSRNRQRVEIDMVAEALARSRTKSLPNDVLSGLKTGSVVGNDPLVVTAVVGKPRTLGHVKSNTDESERLVVRDVWSNVADVSRAASELSINVFRVEAVELGKASVHVRLDDLVDDLEFGISSNSGLIHEDSNIGIQKIRHESNAASDDLLFSALNVGQTLLLLDALALLLTTDFLGSHLLIAFGNLQHDRLIIFEVVAAKQILFTVLAGLNESSGNVMAVKAVKVSDLGK
jgi:hypothetical protein